MQLLGHQIVGRDFLAKHDKALLADGMRVGKSIQTIAAADRLKVATIVVICPASIREQWRRQFRQFSQRDVLPSVFSYEEAVGKYFKFIMNLKPDLLVLDEAHYLKSRRAKRTLAIYGEKCRGQGLAAAAKRVWALTGTPAPNDASELYPILRALFPQVITFNGRILDYWGFVKRYCITETTPFGTKIVGNKNMPDLRKRMEPVMLRRPSSILGNKVLPPETIYLDAAKDRLERLRNDLRRELTPEGYTALCTDQFERVLERVESQVKARIARLTGLAKAPLLAEFLATELDSGLDKVVVFGWHQEVIDLLADNLRSFGSVTATGSVSERDRVIRVDRFQKDPKCRVFVGNIKAAGTGLDLSAACELVFAERSWVPGDNDQASMRIFGTNQTRAGRVRDVVLPGSLDERLTESLRRKSKDLALLFAA